MHEALGEVFDSFDLDKLYNDISKLLGAENLLEELNRLIYDRFLSPTAMTVYLRQLNNQLVEALAYRDTETSLQIFQLMLESNLLGTK